MTDIEQMYEAPKHFSPFLRQLYPVSGIVLNTISTGCIIGYPGVLLPELNKPSSHIQLDSHSASWIASIVGFGIFTGIMCVPLSLQKLGRKITNIIGVLPALGGWGFVVIAKDVHVLLLARYLQGVSMGIQGPVSPLSIGEYSSPVYRGAFLSLITFSLASGILICHACGSFWNYKITAGVSLSFSVISILIMATSPESPIWLASNRKFGKCVDAFIWLRGYGIRDKEELDKMIDKFKKSKPPDIEVETLSRKFVNLIALFKKKSFYKPMLIVLLMFTLSQFSGTNVIPTYTVTITEAVFKDSVDPYTGMLIVDFVRFLATVVGCCSLKKFKVRTVLFTSCIITFVAVIFTATYLLLSDSGYISLTNNWIPVSSLLVYVFGMTSGIYAVPFTCVGEIIPATYRSLGGFLTGVIISVTFFGAVKSSPHLFSSIGVPGAFYVFGSIIAFTSSILYFILPETRGKTLQEIEEYFHGKTSPQAPEQGKMLFKETELTCFS